MNLLISLLSFLFAFATPEQDAVYKKMVDTGQKLFSGKPVELTSQPTLFYGECVNSGSGVKNPMIVTMTLAAKKNQQGLTEVVYSTTYSGKLNPLEITVEDFLKVKALKLYPQELKSDEKYPGSYQEFEISAQKGNGIPPQGFPRLFFVMSQDQSDEDTIYVINNYFFNYCTLKKY